LAVSPPLFPPILHIIHHVTRLLAATSRLRLAAAQASLAALPRSSADRGVLGAAVGRRSIA